MEDVREQINNYLRPALNLVWAKLKEEGRGAVSLDEAKTELKSILDTTGPYPESPDPNAFPFTTRSGSQVE